jgi:ABC-type branched-subunit amino acid transport system substrate-binding protein
MRTRSVLLTVLVLAAGVVPNAAGGTAERRPGVSRSEIKIGLHMPLTGAAPIASESASQGAEVYWKWLRQRGVKINGRYVRAILKNDNYNPSQAVAQCKELVEKDKVFMLAGIMQPTGVDQIQACARYAASVGVPYVSLGTSKIGLKGLPRYFAMTQTWARQGRMLADHLVSDLGARREKNGMLRHETPNTEDTHDAFVTAMSKKRAALDYDRAVSRNASQSEAQAVVAEMKAARIDNVFVLTSPVWFLQVLQAAENQNYRPLWVGIDGIAQSGDHVASVGCRNGNLGRSHFLSALPAFANRDSFDKRHDRAMRKVYEDPGDSITWLGWAGSKAIRKLLEGAGRRLTRARFAESVERRRNVRTGILPPFGFRPRDHFGGRGTHVLSVDCNEPRWVTVRRFVRNF